MYSAQCTPILNSHTILKTKFDVSFSYWDKKQLLCSSCSATINSQQFGIWNLVSGEMSRQWPWEIKVKSLMLEVRSMCNYHKDNWSPSRSSYPRPHPQTTGTYKTITEWRIRIKTWHDMIRHRLEFKFKFLFLSSFIAT